MSEQVASMNAYAREVVEIHGRKAGVDWLRG
jgi:hypothetical protein